MFFFLFQKELIWSVLGVISLLPPPFFLRKSHGCPRSTSLASPSHLHPHAHSDCRVFMRNGLILQIPPLDFFPPYPSLSFYGQKSTWPAKRKGMVEMEKKVRWGKGGGRWKKPLSVTVWHRPFSFRRHSLPVRLLLWSASTKRSFTCSPPREGKIPSLAPERFGFWRFPIRNFHIYLFSFAGFF